MAHPRSGRRYSLPPSQSSVRLIRWFSRHMNELHHFSLFIRQKIAALLRPVFLSLEIQFSDRLKAAGEGLKAYCSTLVMNLGPC